jgi:hypothetical protein
MNFRRLQFALLLLSILCLDPTPTNAYIGPGAGVSVIGGALALVAGVVLAIAGFVWYPIKRLLRLRRGSVR